MKESGFIESREVTEYDPTEKNPEGSSLVRLKVNGNTYSTFSNAVTSDVFERINAAKQGDRVDLEWKDVPGRGKNAGKTFRNIVDIIKVVGLNDDVSAPPRSDSQSNRVDNRDLGMTVGTCMRYAVDLHLGEMKPGIKQTRKESSPSPPNWRRGNSTSTGCSRRSKMTKKDKARINANFRAIAEDIGMYIGWDAGTTFTYGYGRLERYDIPIREQIARIVEHLGLEWVQQPSWRLQPKEKKRGE